MRFYSVAVLLLMLTLIGMVLQGMARLCRFRFLYARIPQVYHWLGLKLLRVRVMQRGTQHQHGSVLMVSNHISWLDIAVLSAATPVSFVAKSEVGQWPFIGWLARLQGTVFVNRKSRMATGATTAAMAERLAQGDRLVLFAEGTSSSGSRVLPLRSSLIGAALQHSSQDREIWVQPVALRYTGLGGVPLSYTDRARIGWYGSMDLLPHFAGVMRCYGIDAEVTYGAPIPITAAHKRKELTLTLEQQIRKMRIPA